MLTKDPRYSWEAYVLIYKVMDFMQAEKGLEPGDPRGHVTGQQLLEALRVHARRTYGCDARRKLNSLGIYTCEDVGEIVFNLVDHGLLRKTDRDSREDFKNGYDFARVFPGPLSNMASVWFWVLVLSLILLFLILKMGD